jgi:multicomponent Na+:H+ antiporter subunit F
MNLPADPVLAVALPAALGMLAVALALAFARLVRGPSLPDRVIALDLIVMIALGFVAADSIWTGQSVVIVPGIALALVAFVGTVAFAYYIERRGRT